MRSSRADRTEDPWMNIVMQTEAAMQLYHPEEYAAIRKLARGGPPAAVTASEHDNEREREVCLTRLRIDFTSIHHVFVLLFSRLMQTIIHRTN